MKGDSMDIDAMVEGKKISELTGELKEYREAGLAMANANHIKNLIQPLPDSEKKGFALGYANKLWEKANVRRMVLRELYKARTK